MNLGFCFVGSQAGGGRWWEEVWGQVSCWLGQMYLYHLQVSFPWAAENRAVLLPGFEFLITLCSVFTQAHSSSNQMGHLFPIHKMLLIFIKCCVHSWTVIWLKAPQRLLQGTAAVSVVLIVGLDVSVRESETWFLFGNSLCPAGLNDKTEKYIHLLPCAVEI